jgi:hypothetical protein
MGAPDQPPPSHLDPPDAVIADYLQQVEAGAVPDRAAVLARHPGLADRLRAYLADYGRVDRQAGELHLSHDPDRTTGGEGQPATCRTSATSGTTNCWKRSPAAAWGSSTRPAKCKETWLQRLCKL